MMRLPLGMTTWTTSRRGKTKGLASLVAWFLSREWTVSRFNDETKTWRDVNELSRPRTMKRGGS